MIWLKVADVANLYNLTKQAIRVKAKKNEFIYRYISGCGYSGKKMEILLSSLSVDAQARYKGLTPLLPNIDSLDNCTSKQQTDANNKYWVVELYQKSSMNVDDFIEWYNREYGACISRPQLFRWQRKLKDGGVAALVDRRGEHKRGTTTIPDDAWEYFYSLYMTQQKRGVQLCYDYTKREYPGIPSVSAFYRRVETIPEYALIRYREGEKAFRDSLPSHDRDKTDIQSNDIWFSDHHRVDVFTRNKDGSKICRMWLTVFFDARSNKVISHTCRDAEPNATVIKQTMKKGMEIHGIPREVYFDNGKDYRSRAFNTDFPLSVIRQLGIGIIYATPYHGQAKTVERFFRTFEERFGRMFPTYTGRDAKNRPEQMQVSNEKIHTYAVPMDTFLECLDRYMEEYNHTPSRGKDMEGKSPDEIYYQNLSVKREITDRHRSTLAVLCGTFDTRTVQKNGITFNNREYQNEKLLPYYKKKVIINYDPENMDELNVFDTEMRAVCTATAKIRTPYRHTTEEDYKAAQKQKKQVRQFVKKYQPQAEQDLITIISQNQFAEKERMDAVYSPAAVEQVMPGIDTEKLGKKVPQESPEADRPEIQDILLGRYKEINRNRASNGGTDDGGNTVTDAFMKKYEMEKKRKTGG